MDLFEHMFSVSKTAFFILAVFLIFPTPLLAQAVSGDVVARRAELESENDPGEDGQAYP